MTTDFIIRLKNSLTHFLLTAGIKAIYVFVTIVIGLILIRIASKILNKILSKSTKIEAAAQSFIRSLSKAFFYGCLLIVVGLVLGIEASAFLTLIGAAGIAIGLALQGSLSNFAGGILILLFKPFRIGDEICINGVEGYIQDINILYTSVKTYDGKIVTMPNGNVSNSDVENRVKFPERRVQVPIRIPFDQDVDQIRAILVEAMKKHPLALQDKPFQVWLSEFSDSSMKMSARCWSKADDYWDVYFDQFEVVKKTLQANNIPFAIPAMEVRNKQ